MIIKPQIRNSKGLVAQILEGVIEAGYWGYKKIEFNY